MRIWQNSDPWTPEIYPTKDILPAQLCSLGTYPHNTMSTDADSPLFPPSLLPTDALVGLPSGFTIRPLRRDDFERGYLDCLRVLTWVGDLSAEEWSQRYDEMAAARGTYYLLAIEHEGRVVGTGSLVVERKL